MNQAWRESPLIQEFGKTLIELLADSILRLAFLLKNKSDLTSEKVTEAELADLPMKVEFRHVSGLKVEAAFVDLQRQLIVSKFITGLRFQFQSRLNWTGFSNKIEVEDKLRPKEGEEFWVGRWNGA